MTDNKTWLFHIEAVNMDASLDDTGHISVRRGASMAMREAVRKIPGLLDEQGVSIYEISTGGSKLIFSATLSHSKKEGLRAEIIEFLQGKKDLMDKKDLNGDKILKEVLPQLSFSVSIVECNDQPEARQRQALLAENRFQQMQLPSIYLDDLGCKEPQEPPDCYLEGKRPADPECHITDNDEKERISRSVCSRYQYGKHQKASFIKSELGLSYDSGNDNLEFVTGLEQLSGINDKQINGEKGDKDRKNSELPENIKGLHSKIAVLYFDGNHMGKRQDAMSNKALADFDKALHKARRGFLAETMALYKENPEALQAPEEKWRLEILLWGGDEILLIVPAWAGFAVLHTFYRAMSEFKGEYGISHAGGLIFCKHNTPIQRLVPLAQELAENAKSFSRSNDYYFPLLLESEDYPVKGIRDYWNIHYQKAGRILMPFSPWSDSSRFTEVLKIKEAGRRSAIRRHTVGMFEAFDHPNDFDLREQELKKWLNEEKLNSLETDLGALFPLIPADKLDTDEKSIIELEAYEQGWDRLSRLLPWIMLVEYWDYLVDLKGTTP